MDVLSCALCSCPSIHSDSEYSSLSVEGLKQFYSVVELVPTKLEILHSAQNTVMLGFSPGGKESQLGLSYDMFVVDLLLDHL